MTDEVIHTTEQKLNIARECLMICKNDLKHKEGRSWIETQLMDLIDCALETTK